MDIVRQKQIREYVLLGLVGVMALVANLPTQVLNNIGLDPGLVMGVLGLLVVLALFLYVRLFFFVLYALLAVGANLPEKWADGLGISQAPLLITLIAMVALSLLNYGAKMLPSGLEPKKRKQNPEATQVLFTSIERGNLPYIKTLLTMDFDLDTIDEEGMTPLMRAAQYGNFKVVQLLIKHGASPLLVGSLGRASDVALKYNFPSVTEYLKKVEEVQWTEAAARATTQPQGDPAAVA